MWSDLTSCQITGQETENRYNKSPSNAWKKKNEGQPYSGLVPVQRRRKDRLVRQSTGKETATHNALRIPVLISPSQVFTLPFRPTPFKKHIQQLGVPIAPQGHEACLALSELSFQIVHFMSIAHTRYALFLLRSIVVILPKIHFTHREDSSCDAFHASPKRLSCAMPCLLSSPSPFLISYNSRSSKSSIAPKAKTGCVLINISMCSPASSLWVGIRRTG